MPKLIDLTGKIYGRLTVIYYDSISLKHRQWMCECSCGKTKIIRGGHLLSGAIQSCGCLNDEKRKQRSTKHGESICGRSKEYRAWQSIRERCYTITHKNYAGWGGRGIQVCDRWINSFDDFLLDMGRSPSKHHSIDRINNDGNYEPGNCRWATAKEQANNRRPRRTKLLIDKVPLISDY